MGAPKGNEQVLTGLYCFCFKDPPGHMRKILEIRGAEIGESLRTCFGNIFYNCLRVIIKAATRNWNDILIHSPVAYVLFLAAA